MVHSPHATATPAQPRYSRVSAAIGAYLLGFYAFVAVVAAWLLFRRG